MTQAEEHSNLLELGAQPLKRFGNSLLTKYDSR